jgi:hypothetical protein
MNRGRRENQVCNRKQGRLKRSNQQQEGKGQVWHYGYNG